MIYLSVALAFSLAISIMFFWYNRQVIKNLAYILTNTREFNFILKEFREHLNGVYTKDTFYGDPTLEGLLEHTKDMVSVTDEMTNRLNEVLDIEQDQNE